jgi:hypothetical protein
MSDRSQPKQWLIACMAIGVDNNIFALYWSNAFGWTSFEEADIFPDAEREFCALPQGGHWVPLREA